LNRAFSTGRISQAEKGDYLKITTPTRPRRAFYAWLDGPGAAFRHPLPDSTNYLSAYDRRGNLLNATERQSPSGDSRGSAETRALEDAATGTSPGPAKQTRDELRPFPLNKQFISESILSEDFRQAIWRKVQIEKRSVRQVSVEMHVDMRRVAAVVRLVEVERRMKAEVRQSHFSIFSCCAQNDEQPKSISLPDFQTW
jgi:hypothetical protein